MTKIMRCDQADGTDWEGPTFVRLAGPRPAPGGVTSFPHEEELSFPARDL
jgi:hypothetical protein